MKDRDRADEDRGDRDREREYDRENGTNGDDRKGTQATADFDIMQIV